ncbi:hypothetical protein Cgig2_027999 [Carnegiea gigantea]|uniref:Uncharacterized protein n=1 Tax=Carnegiea gigantea TaxID=171969 RepID=A0A9Q1GZH8_9CARY|nr:hypothetical protein Cgig2_027999 [Carnegiea gigantea]
MPGQKENKRHRKRAPEAGATSSENVVYLSPDGWFARFEEDVLEDDSLRNIVDGVLRFTIRLTSEAWTRRFAAVPSLLGKNSLWLQLLLIDEDSAIQGKFHALGAKVAFAESDANVVERSRNLFRVAEAIPFLLRGGGGDHWVFSRTLMFLDIEHKALLSSLQSLADFNGLVEDAIDSLSFSPLDCLMELPEHIPSGVRSTEGFWVCAVSAQVSKEKLDELKGVHVRVKKP